MKRRNKPLIFPIIIMVIFPFGKVFAQNVAINATGSSPNISAGLDIDFANKGLLIPRVSLTSTTDVTTIVAPATSLLVYNTNAAMTGGAVGYWYYDGTQWVQFTIGSSWLLTGNTGTTAGTNFLGTTDNQALDIRTNNIIRTRITTKGQIEILNTGQSVFIGESAGTNDDLSFNRNVFVGYQAGNANTTGNSNTAYGFKALYSNTTGNYSTAIGYRALTANTSTGNYNTAVGYNTLSTNTTGDYNTAVGYSALTANTTGSVNTAIGRMALSANTTGYANTAAGSGALYYNTTGYTNTATGNSALFHNISGVGNTAAGYNTLFTNTAGSCNTATGYYALRFNTASYNTAIGYNALQANTTGTNNTAVGYQAFFNGTTYNNSTALGYNTVITASNQIRLGNNTVTSIGGFANWTNVSDARFKKNIQENVPGLEFIEKLRPVTYNLDMNKIAGFLNIPDSLRLKEAEVLKSQMLQTGFIAQEVEEAAKSLNYDFSGIDKPNSDNDYYGLRYADFVVPLVKAVQEQQAKIEELEQLIKKLQNNIKELQNNR